ncbi:TonB-dependent receptor plug domain-containing protein [Flavobacterium sp. N1719]|uniref:TonB-dependent receptor plug domain-containing protein n=1 Tax=Flavobacterium sp. N1719 TaxID=2885633 RepID=UPI0022220953|nr:TonB-dependent receptor [Flavobacterium sp. N1719]
MKKLHCPLILGFLILGWESSGQVVKDSVATTSLSEVIVTGTRTERSVATLPLPTHVIRGEVIQKTGLSRLNEIIQEQTGLITVTDFGGGEGIQMQGLDAAYVMILVDGQPLFGRSAGTLDLSRISVNNIDRIEIIKGASSCLYGSEALAGVINIITKKPRVTDRIHGNFNYKIARFDTHDLGTSLAYGKEKIAIEIFGNYFKTQGYNLSSSDFSKTVEPYSNFTLQPKIKMTLTNRLQLNANMRVFQQSQINRTEVSSERYSGESKIKELNGTLALNHSVNQQLKMVYEFYTTNYVAEEHLKSAQNELFDASTFDQWFYRPEVRLHYTLKAHTISAGLGLNYETLERTYFDQQAQLQSEYAFGQLEWFPHKKWNILAGFRFDHPHQYQTQWSPKLAVNYQWSANYSLKASVGYGFKAPDLRQLYFNFTNSAVGYTVLGYNVAEAQLTELQNQGQLLFTNGFTFTQPLRPESSINFNWGGYYKSKKVTVDYNAFFNTIRDLIDTKAVAQKTNGQNVFSYFNIDKIITYGAELTTTYSHKKELSFTLGYQYLIAKDVQVMDRIRRGEVYARDPETLASFALQSSDYFGLFNRSKHTANVKVNYSFPFMKTTVVARLLYRSKFGLYDTNNNAILDRYDVFVKGYCTANLTFNHDLNAAMTLQWGGVNVFDYKDPSNLPNLAGRQLFARITYQF